MDQTVISILYFSQCPLVFTEECLPIYGSLIGAINYFGTRLRTGPWDNATRDERLKALHEASRLIDRLNFAGKKADPRQLLEFPRVSSAVIQADLNLVTVNITTPADIKIACYEIALKLLDGYDPDFEADNLAATTQGFDGVRATYDRTAALEHTRAGIPSAVAWSYLRPYLVDSVRQVRLSRVS